MFAGKGATGSAFKSVVCVVPRLHTADVLEAGCLVVHIVRLPAVPTACRRVRAPSVTFTNDVVDTAASRLYHRLYGVLHARGHCSWRSRTTFAGGAGVSARGAMGARLALSACTCTPTRTCRVQVALLYSLQSQ
eukprot:1368492-Pyramimonas_sp.AAC.1